MTSPFTASEVRELAVTMGAMNLPTTRDMLRAYADRLEADEGAVPVAYVLKHEKLSFKPTIYYGEVETLQRKFGGEIVRLYTSPSPPDAERLAEALRSIRASLVSVLCDPSDRVVIHGSDYDRKVIAKALQKMGVLAAHCAQAKPPAAVEQSDWPEELMLRDTGIHDDQGGLGQRIFTTAGAGYKKVKYVRADLLQVGQCEPHTPAASVTDTLAVFEVVSGVEGPCLTISRKADGKPRHEYRLAGPKPWGGGNTTHSFKVHTRELREQIDAIEAALAAQENPNGNS